MALNYGRIRRALQHFQVRVEDGELVAAFSSDLHDIATKMPLTDTLEGDMEQLELLLEWLATEIQAGTLSEGLGELPAAE